MYIRSWVLAQDAYLQVRVQLPAQLNLKRGKKRGFGCKPFGKAKQNIKSKRSLHKSHAALSEIIPVIRWFWSIFDLNKKEPIRFKADTSATIESYANLLKTDLKSKPCAFNSNSAEIDPKAKTGSEVYLVAGGLHRPVPKGSSSLDWTKCLSIVTSGAAAFAVANNNKSKLGLIMYFDFSCI